MSGELDLGNLLVHLRLDDSGYQAVQRGVETNVRSTEAAFSGLERKLVGIASAYLSVRAGVRAFHEVFSAGAAADRLGMDVKRLTELQYAAKLSGMAVETFNYHLQTMSRMLAFAANGSGSAKRGLDQLGLSAKVLVQEDPATALRDIADALVNIQNPAQRAAVVTEIFGRNSYEMLRVLDGGSAKFDRLAVDAEKFGATLTSLAVARVRLANESLVQMKEAASSLAQNLVIKLAPSMTVLFQEISKIPSGIDDMKSSAETFGAVAQTSFNKALAAAMTLGHYLKEGLKESWQGYNWIRDKVTEAMSESAYRTEAQRIYRRLNSSDINAFTVDRARSQPSGPLTGPGYTAYYPPQNPELYNGVLARLKAGYQIEDVSAGGETGVDLLDEYVDEYQKNLARVQERIAQVQQQAEDNAKKTDANNAAGRSYSETGELGLATQEQLEARSAAYSKMYADLGQLETDSYNFKLGLLMEERRQYEDATNDELTVTRWYESEKQRLVRETRDRVDAAYYELYTSERHMSKDGYEFQARMLRQQYEEYAKYVKDRAALDKWYAQRQRELEEQRLQESDGFFSGWQAGVMKMQDDLKTLGEIGADSARTFRDAWVTESEKVIFEGGKISDMFRNIALNMARVAYRQASSQLATYIMTAIGIGANALAGSGSTTPLPSTGTGGGPVTPNTGAPGTMYAAMGAALYQGQCTAFDAGGVVYKQSWFPMRRGYGTIAEKEPEAIVPLERTSSGKLGVNATLTTAGIERRLDKLIQAVLDPNNKQLPVIDISRSFAEILARGNRRRSAFMR